MKNLNLIRTQVLLEPEQLKSLGEIAAQQGLSGSALLRRWVEASLHNHRQKQLAEAALSLAESYYSDGELTGYAALDADDFMPGGRV